MGGLAATLDFDAELMLRVKEGDGASFAILLEKAPLPVIHFLYRMVQNQALPRNWRRKFFCACIVRGEVMSRRPSSPPGCFGLPPTWR
jgi:hypothetical protein